MRGSHMHVHHASAVAWRVGMIDWNGNWMFQSFQKPSHKLLMQACIALQIVESHFGVLQAVLSGQVNLQIS